MHFLDNKTTIQALNQDNIAVFEAVYSMYKKPAYEVAFRYLRDSELAQDAIQDIFLKIWENRKNLDKHKSLQGLLYSSLKNHALNLMKSKSRRVSRHCDYAYFTSNEGDNPEYDAIEEDYNLLLAKALEKLPHKKKMVFNLKCKNGFSNEMIALKLNLSNNTVKSHLYQARKFLQEYISLSTE